MSLLPGLSMGLIFISFMIIYPAYGQDEAGPADITSVFQDNINLLSSAVDPTLPTEIDAFKAVTIQVTNNNNTQRQVALDYTCELTRFHGQQPVQQTPITCPKDSFDRTFTVTIPGDLLKVQDDFKFEVVASTTASSKDPQEFAGSDQVFLTTSSADESFGSFEGSVPFEGPADITGVFQDNINLLSSAVDPTLPTEIDAFKAVTIQVTNNNNTQRQVALDYTCELTRFHGQQPVQQTPITCPKDSFDRTFTVTIPGDLLKVQDDFKFEVVASTTATPDKPKTFAGSDQVFLTTSSADESFGSFEGSLPLGATSNITSIPYSVTDFDVNTDSGEIYTVGTSHYNGSVISVISIIDSKNITDISTFQIDRGYYTDIEYNPFTPSLYLIDIENQNLQIVNLDTKNISKTIPLNTTFSSYPNDYIIFNEKSQKAYLNLNGKIGVINALDNELENIFSVSESSSSIAVNSNGDKIFLTSNKVDNYGSGIVYVVHEKTGKILNVGIYPNHILRQIQVGEFDKIYISSGASLIIIDPRTMLIEEDNINIEGEHFWYNNGLIASYRPDRLFIYGESPNDRYLLLPLYSLSSYDVRDKYPGFFSNFDFNKVKSDRSYQTLYILTGGVLSSTIVKYNLNIIR